MSDATLSNAPLADSEWWRGAVIYQVYPRSYADTTGTGVGDLNGITAHLDHIASLGVDALWISPFFKSPMKDYGYDVSDYRDVDPLFGSLNDFDHLVARAHELGLKVLIDKVLSHTSDQHAWFQESRQDRTNPKADWYVWADPKADGTPPNNWLSVFGGSAWAWEPRRGQYYLHNFLAEQPDLNFWNEGTVDAILAECAFWLDRGVDGFRLDTANFYTHDRQLRDNPPKPPGARLEHGAMRGNPYAMQDHRYDKSQPDNMVFLARLRALLDRYPGATSVGEVSDDNALITAATYTRGGKHLHMAYTFDLLAEECDAAYIRERITFLEDHIEDGWPCWSFSNHDVVRVATRWANGGDGATQRTMHLALLLSLRGSPCLYQGEELGLTEADLPYEALQDPVGLTFWPENKGRDGCRTPMPWSDAPDAGFSEATPWLPVPDEHRARAVSLQEADPGSVLNACRRLVALRRHHPALRLGSIAFFDAPADVLVFERAHEDEHLLVVFNLGAEPRRFADAVVDRCVPVNELDLGGVIGEGAVELPGYGAFLGTLKNSEGAR